MLKGEQKQILKKSAIILRKKGYSYPMIRKAIGVANGTLNGWFKNLKLSKKVQDKILMRKRNNLVVLRQKALVTLKYRADKRKREVCESVENDYKGYTFDTRIKELLLAMLYLGEGFKKTRSHIGLGNSNPKIVLLFVKFLRDIYKVDDSRFRCFLHLRMDQNSEIEKNYWSNQLSIPDIYFRKPQFDKRASTKTWPWYHGVCTVYCYDAKIEKRLTVLQQVLIEKSLGG